MIKTKTGKNPKIRFKASHMVIAGIVLLTIVMSVVLIIRTLSGPSQGVPVYSGDKIRGYIDIQSVSKVVTALRQYINISSGIHIVMFGSTECPYCHYMHYFFMNTYPDICRVLWVNVDPNALSIFTILSDVEVGSNLRDLAGMVPHTLVVEDGSVKAIVVGVVTSKDFWDKLFT